MPNSLRIYYNGVVILPLIMKCHKNVLMEQKPVLLHTDEIC